MWHFYKFESCQFYRKKKDIENENFWSDDLRVGYGWNSWIRQRRRKIYETGGRLLCRSPPFTSRYKLKPMYRVFHKCRFSSIISVYRTLKKYNLSRKTSWGNLDSQKFCNFYETPQTLNELRILLNKNFIPECATRMKTRMEFTFDMSYTCAVTDTDTNQHENHKSQRFEVHQSGWRAMCDYQKRMPRFRNF